MPDIFLLKAIAKTLILPPTGLLLIILFGLFLVQRFPRTGRAISIIATVYLLALSTPFASYQLMHFLETSPPLDLKEARHAQAIVILGGGIRNNALEYGGDTVGRLTLDRVRYGARVAKITGLPVLVAGGSVLSGEPEAKLMRETLENEFGVKVRWSEDKSRNTRENAAFSAAMLAKENIRQVVLVTHSFDMPRAKAEFTTSGLQVIAAPTGILNGDLQWPSDYLPGMGGLQASYYVCYELLAKVFMQMSLFQ
ncbi:MAG: YdcF family protein [Candidatus Nitrotoga sp.]